MVLTLPLRDEMIAAYMARDAAYDGVFFTAVRTTGIFCRPTCPARKPRPENVEFFASARDALFSGYRPCRRCRPLHPPGAPPAWVTALFQRVEEDLTRRWTDADLLALDVEPDRARRWFQKHHGMTFHAYVRARRLGAAFSKIRNGRPVAETAFAHGYESLSGFNEAFRQILGAAPRKLAKGPLVVLSRLLTPLGPMIAGATDDALCFLEFADRRLFERQLARLQTLLDGTMAPGSNRIIEQTRTELDAYFSGTLQTFTIPLATPGTPFQQHVWTHLRTIPYGCTTTYGALAEAVGRPTAARAVAQANGANRLAVVIPCHRVIGKGDQITGYGGGVWRKQRLLDHEALHRRPDTPETPSSPPKTSRLLSSSHVAFEG
jgi:AraC family transcriptional regulator of adaptative response/methylated-DNA-[protein]-cysteine methyltransferase